ncbi:VOC family protein [Roseinatronobacter sp.]
MRIYVTSVFVDDQATALDFYTQTLGFAAKNDVPGVDSGRGQDRITRP